MPVINICGDWYWRNVWKISDGLFRRFVKGWKSSVARSLGQFLHMTVTCITIMELIIMWIWLLLLPEIHWRNVFIYWMTACRPKRKLWRCVLSVRRCSALSTVVWKKQNLFIGLLSRITGTRCAWPA